MMPQNQPNNLVRYSNLAIQMGLIIGGSTWLGSIIDDKLHLAQPWFTIILALTGIGSSLYLIIKDVLKNQ